MYKKIQMNARADVSSEVIGQNFGQATSSANIYIFKSWTTQNLIDRW